MNGKAAKALRRLHSTKKKYKWMKKNWSTLTPDLKYKIRSLARGRIV